MKAEILTFGVFDTNIPVQSTFRDLVTAMLASAERRPLVSFERFQPSDTDKIPPGYNAVVVNDEYEELGAMVAGTIDGASEIHGFGSLWRFTVDSITIGIYFLDTRIVLEVDVHF